MFRSMAVTRRKAPDVHKYGYMYVAENSNKSDAFAKCIYSRSNVTWRLVANVIYRFIRLQHHASAVKASLLHHNRLFVHVSITKYICMLS